MIKAIPMEDWLRGCIYHDGRSGYVTLPTDKVHQIANYIQRTRRSGTDGLIDLKVVEADRKTEPTISKMEQVDKDTNVLVKDCETCKYKNHNWWSNKCDPCCRGNSRYEPKDEHSGEVTEMVEPQKCYLRESCDHYGDKQVCGRCRSKNLYAPKDEPQPRCPKCGARGYIRSLESMGVKLKVFDEYKWKCTNCNKYFKEEPKTEPQTECSACDTCLWYNSGLSCGVEPSVCKRAVEYEPQTEEEILREQCRAFIGIVEQTERNDMSEIDKMIKMVDGILGDDGLCEGCEDGTEGLSCAECTRKYADKIIKILRDVKHKVQTERSSK